MECDQRDRVTENINWGVIGDDRRYRLAPFWSWNDDLDSQELRRQIQEMKQAGLGGFFMHSRCIPASA